MALELDHLFIFTSVGAREVEQLLKFGLTEGEPNTHAGQGTACRRFFFLLERHRKRRAVRSRLLRGPVVRRCLFGRGCGRAGIPGTRA